MMTKKYSILSAVLLSSSLLMSTVALADDDRDEKYEDYEHENNYNDYKDYEYEGNYEEYEEDEDYEYEEDDEYYEQGGYTNYTTITQPVTPENTWNVWSRETINTKGNLPFSEAKTVTMKLANNTATIKSYVIPRDGEIFVPAQNVAEFLQADVKYYPTSTIVEVKSAATELVFRADTNVVYENNKKTPLPASAFTMNSNVYVPISAIANGLNYTVEWQEASNSFVYTQQ